MAVAMGQMMVAALHSELVKSALLRDFWELDPGTFHNVTNGVTPRRWVVLSNPRLAALITSKIGDKWIHEMESQMQKLENPLENQKDFPF